MRFNKNLKLLILNGLSSIIILISYLRLNDDYTNFKYLINLKLNGILNNIYSLPLNQDQKYYIVNHFFTFRSDYYILLILLFIIFIIITDMFIKEFKLKLKEVKHD